MKKAVMVIAIFTLMVGSAAAFPNDPNGWGGWKWGTPISEISTKLTFEKALSELPKALLFTNTEEYMVFLGDDRTTQLPYRQRFIFLDDRLVGVKLDSTYQGFRGEPHAIAHLRRKHGEFSFQYEVFGYTYRIWEGDPTYIILQYYIKGQNSYIYMGEASFIASLRDKFLENLMPRI